jgi:hypothetical protein
VGLASAIREFLYGMTGYEFARQANGLRHESGVLLMLLCFGDMVGLPVLPPLFALQILPYVVPELDPWKRSVLRERHALDKEEFDLIEM